MELIGTVLEIRQDRAIVRFQKGCDGNCKSCPMGHLFISKDSDICEVEAFNQARAVKGDKVRMEIGAKIALSAYVLAYGFPFAGFLAGAIAGGLLAPLFPLKDNTIFIAIFAFVGLGVCFMITVNKGKRFKALPVIVEILSSTETGDS
jgi:positive regulator of sigma E activity